jgi:phage terminase large subunit-like protein
MRECIVSVTKQRIPAAQVGDEIESVAKCDGKDVEIAIEYEKGSMGYIGPAELARRLIGKGFKVLLVKRPHGAKHVVWQPLFNKAWQMKQSGAGFPIVEGPNVEDFLKSVDAAPSPAHDDELDGVSGAHNVLTGACESESATGGIQARGE